MAQIPRPVMIQPRLNAGQLGGRVVRPARPLSNAVVPVNILQQPAGALSNQIAQIQLQTLDVRHQVLWQQRTFTRSQLKVALRKAGKLQESTQFEWPDGSPAHLPVYRLATHVVGSKSQYRMSIRAEGTGALVEFFLEAIAPDGIDSKAVPATVEHQINVAVTYQPGGGPVERRLDADISAAGSLTRASFALSSLEQVDELINALTSERSNAGIHIIRSVKNAVPIPITNALPARPGLIINLPRPGKSKVLPRAGGGRIDLTGQSSIPQRYLIISSSLAQQIPLAFESNRHDYIFADFSSGTGASTSGKGFVKHLVAGDSEPYFQDPVDLGVFFYLPDRYELSRIGSSDSRLQLFVIPGSEIDEVELNFAAVPFVERERLEAAAQLLIEHSGGREVRMKPMPFVDWTYSLKLPFRELEQRVRQPGPGSVGFTDSVMVSREQLQIIWDGLSGVGSPLVFGGSVEVKLPASSVAIPFTPRLSDIGGGSVFEVELGDAGDGKLSLRLTNAIESPLEISDLECSLLAQDAPAGSDPVSTELNGLNGTTVLEPQQSLELVCKAHEVVSAIENPEVLLDVSGVKILPALGAIIEGVMDARVVESGFSTEFIAFFPAASSGTEATGPSPMQPASVTVELPEHGQTFVLKPKPEGPDKATIIVQRPLAEALLGVPVERSVTYRWTVVRQGSIDPPLERTTDQAVTAITLTLESPPVTDTPASA